MGKWTAENIPDLTGKIAIVTGSNTGIGFEEAKALAGKGATTILACRNMTKAEAAVSKIKQAYPKGDVQAMNLDLSSLDSVKSFADSFSKMFDRLDILINNAGVMMPPYSKTKDGFELQFGTNHLGHFVLTGYLLPLLEKSDYARIVVLSSMAGKRGVIFYDDIHYQTRRYAKWESYCQSKVSNLVFTKELNERLRKAGSKVKVLSAHPGWTATDLQRHTLSFQLMNPLFAMKPWKGALPALYAATAEDVESGKFYGPDGLMEMWGYPKEVEIVTSNNKEAFKPENENRLWEISEKLTGFQWDFNRQG